MSFLIVKDIYFQLYNISILLMAFAAFTFKKSCNKPINIFRRTYIFYFINMFHKPHSMNASNDTFYISQEI